MSEMVTIPRAVVERALDALCGAKGYSASMMSFHVNKVDAGIRDCRTALAAGEARPAEPSDAKDAARYRWLRDPETGDASPLLACFCGQELDAAIDAAMRVGSGGSGA